MKPLRLSSHQRQLLQQLVEETVRKKTSEENAACWERKKERKMKFKLSLESP